MCYAVYSTGEIFMKVIILYILGMIGIGMIIFFLLKQVIALAC